MRRGIWHLPQPRSGPVRGSAGPGWRRVAGGCRPPETGFRRGGVPVKNALTARKVRPPRGGSTPAPGRPACSTGPSTAMPRRRPCGRAVSSKDGDAGRHWAFRAPVRPALPPVQDAAGAQPHRPLHPGPAGKGRAVPSPEADRVTLIRRLSLDLIGLPPTLAGGRCVPRRHARRTPTRSWSSGCWRRRTTASAGAGTGSTPPATPTRDGYEKDKPRYVWFYRDWVINALNRDLPYDQFVIEQIAGDLLPNADAGPDRRHRLPAQLDDQRGRRHRPRAVPHGGDVRPHGRDRQGRPRPDDPVRPVPQPQVRPAHAGGVLPAVRLPQQRPRGRTSPSTRPTSR